MAKTHFTRRRSLAQYDAVQPTRGPVVGPPKVQPVKQAVNLPGQSGSKYMSAKAPGLAGLKSTFQVNTKFGKVGRSK